MHAWLKVIFSAEPARVTVVGAGRTQATMSARGAKGGRPSKLERLLRNASSDPRQGKISISRHFNVTFNGPVTVHGIVGNSGAAPFASSAAAHVLGQKRPREDSADEEDQEDPEDSEDRAADASADDSDGARADAPAGGGDGGRADAPANSGAPLNAPRDGTTVNGGTPMLSTKRRRYTAKEQARVVEICKENKGNLSATIRQVQKEAGGYKDLSRHTVSQWMKAPREPKKMGRKVEVNFETDVIGNLMFFTLEDVGGDQKKLAVVANAAYSYESIRNAASLAQKMGKWREHATVKNLKLGNGWINSFLKRNNLHRRRVTTTEKVIPPAAEVEAHMRKIQDIILDNGMEPGDVINADETGIFFGAKPKNQYVPRDAARASAPDSNDKARFTAVMWGAADGVMGMPFVIIKNAVAGFVDQSSSTCLDGKHIMKQVGFRAHDGWEHRVWTKDMEITVKGKVYKGLFKRNYIIHKVTGAVITANKTAWMDTVTMVMWVELQLGPWRATRGRRTLLVMDNCGPHGVGVVKEAFVAQGILVEHLPPNMTGELQVMDLVVNGPLKAAIRRERCMALHTNFLEWKADWKAELDKAAAEQAFKPFDPPTVTLADGLRTLFATCASDFRADNFVKGLRKAFVNVGLALDTSMTPPFFHKYKGNSRKGTIPRALASADAIEDAVLFADAAVRLELERRPVNVLDDEQGGVDDSDGDEAPVAVSPRREPTVIGVAKGTTVGESDVPSPALVGGPAPLGAFPGPLTGTRPRPTNTFPTRSSGRASVPSRKYAW